MNSKSVTGDRSERKLAKRRKIGRINCFVPYELISMILAWLPADVLYNIMRYVCKEWYNIIESPKFIYSHIQNSTSGLLMRSTFRESERSTRFSVDGCGIKLKELKFKCISSIQGSCNGLVFVLGHMKEEGGRCCYVINLIRKQLLPLPLIQYPRHTFEWYIGYASASRTYKILSPNIENFIILSVGVDKSWRKIDITHLTYEGKSIITTMKSCVVIRGVVYMARLDGVAFNPIVLCFEMETETFKEIILPKECMAKCYKPLKRRDDCLCLWNKRTTLSYEFWMMNNLENGHVHGKWERLYVDLSSQRGFIEQMVSCDFLSIHIERIVPFGWLRNGELLVLVSPGKIIFFYNVITGIIHQHEDFIKNYACPSFKCFHHIDTLVPINNLSLVVPPRETFICRHKLYSQKKMRANFHLVDEEEETS